MASARTILFVYHLLTNQQLIRNNPCSRLRVIHIYNPTQLKQTEITKFYFFPLAVTTSDCLKLIVVPIMQWFEFGLQKGLRYQKINKHSIEEIQYTLYNGIGEMKMVNNTGPGIGTNYITVQSTEYFTRIRLEKENVTCPVVQLVTYLRSGCLLCQQRIEFNS